MKKKDIGEDAKLAKTVGTTRMKCGECLHFKHKPHRDKLGLCSLEGIGAAAIAPKCYTPDVTKILQSSDQLIVLTQFYNGLTYQQRKILAAVLTAKSKKDKLKVGTKVYFLAIGKDYLSNYLSGYVVMHTSAGEIVVSGDPDKTRRGNPYLAFFKTEDSFFTVKEFKAKREDLKNKGRIYDPNNPFKRKKTSITVDYDPPTIDNAPSEWRSKRKEETRSKFSTPVDKLIIS